MRAFLEVLIAVTMIRRLSCGLLLVCILPIPGCGSYVLAGKVVQGLTSDMTFVAPDDPRLDRPGVSNVRISVQRDPDRLSRHLVGTGLSDGQGRFSISLDEFGAGWMDEQWLIQASKDGFKAATLLERLQRKHTDMRLLIMLAPGASEDPDEQEDLMREYERFR